MIWFENLLPGKIKFIRKTLSLNLKLKKTSTNLCFKYKFISHILTEQSRVIEKENIQETHYFYETSPEDLLIIAGLLYNYCEKLANMTFWQI